MKALVEVFTFVGLFKVVQSNQRSSFMSGLFQCVLFQLGIQQVMIDYSVSYYSWKFNNHQVNYSTSEKEAFALLSALQYFDVYLSAAVSPVEAFTDHNLLVFIHKIKNKNERLLHWSLALQENCLVIWHIKGKDNVIADALSQAIDWSTEWHWWHVHYF